MTALADQVRELLRGKGVEIVDDRVHMKARERYLDARFAYPRGRPWDGAVPVAYPRWGIGEEPQPEEAAQMVAAAYESLRPARAEQWARRERKRWSAEHDGKTVTRPIFEKLLSLKWQCPRCDLPRNSNPQRRIQALKEMGYLLATSAPTPCPKCGENALRFLLLPMDARPAPGYETIGPKLRKRILRVLDNYDAYEGKRRPGTNLLPDHKFPEIAWDADTPRKNPEDMSDGEIRDKFQLLDNQRNLEKREACRKVKETRQFAPLFGIEHYLGDGPDWPGGVPMVGKASEAGWRLCPWYDIEAWRRSLNARLRRGRRGRKK